MSIGTYNFPLSVALVEPEIPNNTGNIGRTCVAVGASLFLVGSLGFEVSDTQLKRAGLDYWPFLSWSQIANLEKLNVGRNIYFSAHATTSFYDFKFQKEDVLVFGKESKGLDPDLIKNNPDTSVYIPTPGPVRSLNLATAVAIGLYEAFRQIQSVR